jgi:hypothetical protein
MECLAQDYDIRIGQLEAPLRRFVDLSDDAPHANDVYEAVESLKAKGQERLIARHQLSWRTIDSISDRLQSDAIDHLRRYVDERAWTGTSWDESDLVSPDWTLIISRVDLFTDRPAAWVLSTRRGTLDVLDVWLFESSADGARAVQFIGHLGGEGGLGDFDALFVRFHGQPFVVEWSIFEDPLIYDLDDSKPIKH